MAPFLKWWFIVGSFVVLLFAAGYLGLLQYIYNMDVTKICFIILGLFLFQTIKMGRAVYLCCKSRLTINQYKNVTKNANWYGMFFQALGFLGTIIGFVLMLKGMSEVNLGTPGFEKELMKIVSLGMATAFYTTLVGLVCSIVFELQYRCLGNYRSYREQIRDCN